MRKHTWDPTSTAAISKVSGVIQLQFKRVRMSLHEKEDRMLVHIVPIKSISNNEDNKNNV